MRKEFFDRASETGYNKFSEMGRNFQRLLTCCEAIRDDINVFLMLHSESVNQDTFIKSYKVSTIGKMLDDKYKIEEVVSNLLYCEPKYDAEGKPTYGFYTHRCVVDSIEIPSKTPDGMFEEDFIPNDLAYVVEKIEEYK